jgi:hypothetical protein
MTKDNPTPTDIFTDKENMLKVWIDERRSRDYSVGLMWENLKLFSVLIPAIITANSFFLGLTLDDRSWSVYDLLSIVFPVLIVSLSMYGNKDLRRRWRRTMEAIAHLRKLEKLLGLDSPVPGGLKVFKNDTHLFQRYTNSSEGITAEKDYMDQNMDKSKGEEDNMYTAMRRIYWVFIIIGAALLVPPVFTVVLLFYQRYLYFLTLGQ